MRFNKKLFLILFFFVFCGALGFQAKQAQAASVSAPTILESGAKRISATSSQVYISGLTQAGTEILVYVNGQLSGSANVTGEGTETDSFYYRGSEFLSEGEHAIVVLARSKSSMSMSYPTQISVVVPGFSAPTLVGPSEKDAIGKPKPFITGLTLSGTFVHIYIDGVYNGKTDILFHESGTANFAYVPFLNLEKGAHEVWAVAEDENGQKSQVSGTLNFKIEDPMPAPTMLDPIVNQASSEERPFIVGLAKNDSLIKVFIDEKIDGQFLVKNHESGTANFAYQPSKALASGPHIIHTTASDARGKESIDSNQIVYEAPTASVKSTESATEAEQILGDKITDETADEATESSEDLGDESVDAGDDSETEEQSALVEEKSGIGSKPEIIVFIVFVLGVIAWIIWVNRELVKEKQARSDKQPEKDTADKKSDTEAQNSKNSK